MLCLCRAETLFHLTVSNLAVKEVAVRADSRRQSSPCKEEDL
jgi:hypothetical protein